MKDSTRHACFKTIASPIRLICLLLGMALFVPALYAQTPSAQDMIERLKAKVPSPIASPTDAAAEGDSSATGRTRSLRGNKRNLAVDAPTAVEGAASAESPSLSLQIQFDFDSARIKPESIEPLSNLANALQSKELSEAKFAIEGHTDARGKQDYNLRLSQHRADAVREFLVSKGVEATRLASIGKGASNLANKDEPLAAENRRVKIVNLR